VRVHLSAPAALVPVLARIAADAPLLDRAPAFPTAAFAALAEAGVLGGDLGYDSQLELVRAVAAADGSVARILDGHLNAVERLRLLASPEDPAIADDLAAITAGELWLGLWGADPIAGEGAPATLSGDRGSLRLSGSKVFCSGAGGVHRAVVLARPQTGAGPPWLVYVDLSEGARVDRGWYRGAGMRASESHRVEFDGARVIAVLGAPGELSHEPWFSRDAIRTAASWAGMADSAVASAIDALAAKPRSGELEALAVGRMLTAQQTIEHWLTKAALDAVQAPLRLVDTSIHLRDAVAQAALTILDEASRACGSRPFATGSSLDRARRDLDLLLLQHRLDPLVAKRGRLALEAAR
jgi:alkylation response protein AidB-like acyl-CoA dehydrogenase